jgi:hypothetical protein
MKKQVLITIGLGLLLATATQASQEKLAQSIRETQLETANTSGQLGATLSSLNDLTKQTKGDLRPTYDKFCADVARTQKAAAVTRTRAQWMDTDGQQYFKGWQESINSIANEKLRKKAQKRMNEVQGEWTKAKEALSLAGQKFTPFLSDLTDVQKALATDVTPGGVKAVRGTVKSANWNQQFVDKAIKAALKELGKMEKSLSSEIK